MISSRKERSWLPRISKRILFSKSFLVVRRYIFVSLTPQRKRLYGDINKYRKKLMWKLIWSYNGRQDLSKKEAATGQHAFDNTDDFAKFTECFIKYPRLNKHCECSNRVHYTVTPQCTQPTSHACIIY